MKKIKRIPTFKQMAFETAVRNPERYIRILKALKAYDQTILNDDCLLKIVCYLYLIGEFSSKAIEASKYSSVDSIKGIVKLINSTRRADGGFPSGYASRFWTYMRTLSELGLVYAQYNEKFILSVMAKRLISGEIDEQEAFSVQAMKYNRRSPYRNVSNDFNYFKFILEVLLRLRDQGKMLSYEQFIISMFSRDGNSEEFLKLIGNKKFKNYNKVYAFLSRDYDIKTKIATVTSDYPDVVRRILIISGFITIRYVGMKFIQLNENKLEYIKDLLKVKFELTDNEKCDAKKYFEKFNNSDDEFLTIVKKYRKDDKLDAGEYTNRIFSIISLYKINEDIICKSIKNIGKGKTSLIKEFQEIPDPLKLEFYIAILVALIYGRKFIIRPNYKADHIGKPYSHAPGNVGDIEVFSQKIYWLIEVTLIRNKTQQYNNETTSLIRHFISNKEFIKYENKYLSFIAPVIHDDTKEFFEISVIKQQVQGGIINIKPYGIQNFIDITTRKENFIDMENYKINIFNKFKLKLDHSYG